jgi:hypothetical protein
VVGAWNISGLGKLSIRPPQSRSSSNNSPPRLRCLMPSLERRESESVRRDCEWGKRVGSR